MTWLVFGQVGSDLVTSVAIDNMPKWFEQNKEFRWRDMSSALTFSLDWISFVVLQGVPAVGGFIVVAQMLKEFGVCDVVG